MSQADNLAALATNVNSSGVLQPAGGGTGTSTSTGTGSVVLSNSPTLVTPTLGSASATQLATGLGSAGAPALTFTGDTNTGIFSPTADTIAFSEGGVESMRIDSSGLVGIGTSSPSTLLHISSANTAFTATSTTATSSTQLRVVTGAGTCYFAVDGSGGGSFGTANAAAVWNSINSPILFATNNSERMRIDSSGNVGIGVTTIGTNGARRVLQIADSTNGGAILLGNDSSTSTNNARIVGNSGTELILAGGGAAGIVTVYTNNTERMRIDSSGNVGIGTNNPNQRLQVSGTGSQYTSIVSTDSGNTGVIFGDSGRVDEGYVIYVNSDNSLRFGANNATERMRITSAGLLQFDSGYGSVATAYGCRAWVNFNGTGTIAIRGSGNVSSIGDNGTGDYTVNFSTAMPDTNYASLGSPFSSTNRTGSGYTTNAVNTNTASAVKTTSANRFVIVQNNDAALVDMDQVNYVAFR